MLWAIIFKRQVSLQIRLLSPWFAEQPTWLVEKEVQLWPVLPAQQLHHRGWTTCSCRPAGRRTVLAKDCPLPIARLHTPVTRYGSGGPGQLKVLPPRGKAYQATWINSRPWKMRNYCLPRTGWVLRRCSMYLYLHSEVECSMFNRKKIIIKVSLIQYTMYTCTDD